MTATPCALGEIGECAENGLREEQFRVVIGAVASHRNSRVVDTYRRFAAQTVRGRIGTWDLRPRLEHAAASRLASGAGVELAAY